MTDEAKIAIAESMRKAFRRDVRLQDLVLSLDGARREMEIAKRLLPADWEMASFRKYLAEGNAATTDLCGVLR